MDSATKSLLSRLRELHGDLYLLTGDEGFLIDIQVPSSAYDFYFKESEGEEGFELYQLTGTTTVKPIGRK